MFNFNGWTKPELLAAIQKLLCLQVIAAIVLTAIVYVIFGGQHAYLFFMGLVWALADDSLVFGSAYRGMGQTAQQNKRLLKIVFAVRLALALILVFIFLRMKLGLLEVLLGFVLMHICFIFNLLIFTRRNKKIIKAVEKGGKEDGSC